MNDVAKINEYVCTGKWPDGERNVVRNVQDPVAPKEDDAKEKEGSATAQIEKEGTRSRKKRTKTYLKGS